MRLKRLEMVGFKSFANRVCLEFGSGITAIVGPNGSGKSNISDAVRWVLGEQSARQLRGSKMEDVIFSGSDGKKPLGMAEVQLTLDNSEGYLPIEFAEVTVTRRVYRSGESQFMINGRQCRLKDIQDLFTDTGLGREGYAIIGQGQIDAVLSVRSQDRRVLLEETAGIIKYRQRKEEALKKIEQTNQDLVRVTDILNELDQRLGPLQKEAEKARRYQELAGELLSVEQDFYALQLQEIDTERTSLAAEYRDVSQMAEKIGIELAELEQKAAEVNRLLQELELNLEQGQARQIELAERQNALDSEIALKNERRKNNTHRLSALAELRKNRIRQKADLEDKQLQVKTELEAALLKCRVVEEQIGAEERQFAEQQKRRDELRTALETAKDEFFEFMRSLTELRNFQRNFAKEEETLAKQIEVRQQAAAESASRLDEVEKAAVETQRLHQLYEAQMAETQKKAAEFKQKRVALSQEAARVEGKIRSVQAQATKIQARLNTLRELDADYEGYAVSVKRLMQTEAHRQLILGTVADVIQVPPGLELAFEVALGSALQNIITPNESAAQRLIEWLKQTNGGRATFLPLDAMRSNEFPPALRRHLEQPGVLGTGAELAQYDPKFKPVISSLLGRTVITEDLDSALALRRTLRSFSRIVTRDGSVVFPSGAMTGGSQTTRTSGLLSRKSEIAQLEAELDRQSEQAKQLQAALKELQDALNEIDQDINALAQDEIQSRLELQRLNQTLEQLKKDAERELESKIRLEEDIAHLQETWQNLLAQQETAAAKLSKEEEAESDHRAAIHNLEQDLHVLEQEINEMQSKIGAAKVKLAEEKGGVEKLRMQLTNVDSQLEEVEAVLVEAQTEETELTQGQAQLAEEIAAAEKALEQIRQERKELAARLEQFKEERDQKKAELAELNTRLQNTNKQKTQVERRLYRLESDIQLKAGSETRILELLQERELNPEEVRNRTVEKPKAELKSRIDGLRDQIRGLGMVNPTAAEEYDQVRERHHFLTIQLNDLNDAKAQLKEVIEEMDEVCISKFMETFTAVRSEFKKLFTELFRGGQADLFLTDPDSPLTTGIEIMAQPPGKKLQNLLLLSGGERALTAIALLFAIRRVRPTPFCILDEIDAALDEANLHRFAKLMRQFSQTTQVLTITHRQATMEAADALYGVTMNDDAVSQIISVKMNQEG